MRVKASEQVIDHIQSCTYYQDISIATTSTTHRRSQNNNKSQSYSRTGRQVNRSHLHLWVLQSRYPMPARIQLTRCPRSTSTETSSQQENQEQHVQPCNQHLDDPDFTMFTAILRTAHYSCLQVPFISLRTHCPLSDTHYSLGTHHWRVTSTADLC